MINSRQNAGLLAVMAFGIWSGGCSSSIEAPSWTMPEAPKLPTLDQVAALTAPAEAPPAGSATELYTKVARGAVGCWFGANGPLKKDFIYHAEADAPSRGGKAEITIHQRDPTNTNPRGPKAYQIKIDPKDETNAAITATNLKMTEPQSVAMTADVNRWSRGDAGCAGKSATAGWTLEMPAAPAAVPAKPDLKKAKKKAATPAKPASPSAN